MMHVLRVFAAVTALGIAGSPLRAQDQAAGAGGADELRELRKAVEQQAKQIEMLTREVARLGAALEGKPSLAAPGGSAPAPAREESPGTTTPPPGTEDFSANPPPKAEPARPRHIVVKGDTLTSIAKQYNITIPELQKANKDVNERKLQIGQSLLLPPNAQTKAPAATPEAKPAATPEPKQNP